MRLTPPIVARLPGALAGGYRTLVHGGRRRAQVWAAAAGRRLLRRTVFIGVTGSAGKTMTKELIAAVLATRWAGQKSANSRNQLQWVARTILATRPWHRFCVVEVAASGPGTLDGSLRLLRPHVGVVTLVGDDHRSAFRTRAATAEEKGKLVACLPPDGTAVLNADDSLVLDMRARCVGRVVTYGQAPDALVRATDVRGAWPDRLTFTVHHAGEVWPVQTRFTGTHWVPSVLAALATGVALGVPLARAVAAVGGVEPLPGRLSPVTDRAGVTFLRDEWKAPLWSMRTALSVLAEARAPRKIAVIGTISDFNTGRVTRHVTALREVRALADHVVFVGPYASRGLRARRGPDDTAVRAFGTVRQASDYLETLLQPGDLVLLKASNADHLERIVLRRTIGVACWLTRCGLSGLCDTCSRRTIAAGDRAAQEPGAAGRAAPPAPAPEDGTEWPQVIVGLGNPGERYRDTLHNLGRRAVDRLAERLGARWAPDGDAQVAAARVREAPVLLVKLEVPMNNSGPALRRLVEDLGARPEQCIAVHDDLDLPLGAVRTRLKGGAGGHLGVRSILDTFQSEAVRRVKVGIDDPTRRREAGYLLSPIAPDSRDTLHQACDTAVTRIVELVLEAWADRRRAAEPAEAPPDGDPP